jgi:hypothetical protein
MLSPNHRYCCSTAIRAARFRSNTRTNPKAMKEIGLKESLTSIHRTRCISERRVRGKSVHIEEVVRIHPERRRHRIATTVYSVNWIESVSPVGICDRDRSLISVAISPAYKIKIPSTAPMAIAEVISRMSISSLPRLAAAPPGLQRLFTLFSSPTFPRVMFETGGCGQSGAAI